MASSPPPPPPQQPHNSNNGSGSGSGSSSGGVVDPAAKTTAAMTPAASPHQHQHQHKQPRQLLAAPANGAHDARLAELQQLLARRELEIDLLKMQLSRYKTAAPAPSSSATAAAVAAAASLHASATAAATASAWNDADQLLSGLLAADGSHPQASAPSRPITASTDRLALGLKALALARRSQRQTPAHASPVPVLASDNTGSAISGASVGIAPPRQTPTASSSDDDVFESLTDAAINNLSQLAALQEQCESQRPTHSQQQPAAQMAAAGCGARGAAASTNNQLRHNQQHSSPGLIDTAAVAAMAADPSSRQHPLLQHHQQHTSPAPSSSLHHHQQQQQHQHQPQYHYPTLGVAPYAAASIGAIGSARIVQPLQPQALPEPSGFHNLHHHQQARAASATPLISGAGQPPSQVQVRSESGASTSSGFISPLSSLRKHYASAADKLVGGQKLVLSMQTPQQQQCLSPTTAGGLVPASRLSSATPSSGFASPLLGLKQSQLRLNNMQIKHKFGHLGQGVNQFNSPHGFCMGLDQEIVVADTNNHRVCIFDKNGAFIKQFGVAGKEDGQLWNPRKIVILPPPPANSAIDWYNEPLFVVCDRGAERSRMQLFTKDGVYVKKIPLGFIDIVAGLAITKNGSIAAVDSVQPTVYIISVETAALGYWFDCSDHMREPSDIAVKVDPASSSLAVDKTPKFKSEFFICDFKGHCVVVYSEDGQCLRRIGHEFLTAYPNGIDISDDGDILVGDSHGNRFHVVVFDRNGNFVSQFECPHVKVSRCCGLKITREGYIVTLAKNNHHVLVLDTIHI